MNENEIIRHLSEDFEDVHVTSLDGSHFFFTGPERNFPFVTLVTSDAHDPFSNLERPGIFRLNIGLSRETFLSHFGSQKAAGEGHDFTALSRLMPHPVYGSMFWSCILNPDRETYEQTVRPLLAEAYGMTAARQAKRNKDSGGDDVGG